MNGTFNELEYIDAITFTIGRGDLETGSMSSQTSNTMGNFFDLSTDDEKMKFAKNVTYVYCPEQKTLDSYMKISCMEVFVKRVKIAY